MNHNSEYLNLKSLTVYELKHLRFIIIFMIAGMVLLSLWNLASPGTYSSSVTETDVISEEELEELAAELEEARDTLDALYDQLETQQAVLDENRASLEEYEAKWNEDIQIRTTVDDRYEVKIVYQFDAVEESDALDKVLNGIEAVLGDMYDEIAQSFYGDYTAYDVTQLFTVSVDTSLAQIRVGVNDETREGAEEMADLANAWMDAKFAAYLDEYPDEGLSMVIADREGYTYYDETIFSAQRSASDKKISLENAINTAMNNIKSTNSSIDSQKTKIETLEEEIEQNEALRDNTIDLSDGRMVSRTSIVIYLILGAVLGLVFGAVIAAFRFMYGRKIRDVKDLEVKFGKKLLGSLYDPGYKEGKDRVKRMLDRWEGIADASDEKEREEMLALSIKMQLGDTGKRHILLTGTVDEDVLEDTCEKLRKWLHEGEWSLSVGVNPLNNPDTVRKICDADAVICIEQVGVSRVAVVRLLADFMERNNVPLLGVVAC